jgi:hypothetical protein
MKLVKLIIKTKFVNKNKIDDKKKLIIKKLIKEQN